MNNALLLRFPESFRILPEAVMPNCPRIILSSNSRIGRLLSRESPKRWQSLCLNINGEFVYLSLNGWEVYADPRLSPSEQSGAMYCAQAEIGSFGFLLQLLPPHSKTSEHWHEERREFYYLLAGESEVFLGGHLYRLDKPGQSQLMIPTAKGPEGFHPVITKNQSSLMIVQMEGGLDREDHNFI